MTHTVEKIGGTSMSDYAAVRDNIVLNRRLADCLYNRIFVVSAYSGITDQLLEHKKTGQPGVYALFANADEDAAWRQALELVRGRMEEINAGLFTDAQQRQAADAFIGQRLSDVEQVLDNLQRLCRHGHFELEQHLLTVREMLASLGEAHSAWNMAQLLRQDDINARFVDLTGWHAKHSLSLDEHIHQAFAGVDLSRELPIVTGYAHCDEGQMGSLGRGYSEMTFSRIAVLTGAAEGVIHKEYHLSSADPRVVEEGRIVPIGRTNYDVADQLANLGMEAIHPKAAKGMRQSGIPLRIKNTFEPDHTGTLITGDYVSETPCVEIIAGRRHVYAVEIFDQDMVGDVEDYDREVLDLIDRFRAAIVTKDINANTITHYLDTNLKTIKRLTRELSERYPGAEVDFRTVAIVSAIGSDMQVPGILAKSVGALADAGIGVLAMHQSMRQVDMQFVIDEAEYELAVQSLHKCMIEPHNHGYAICAAAY
jgi:aspartate kinase